MERNDIKIAIINYLRPYKPEKIGIFGSYARQEETMDSDIDILVKFRETITLLELARIHRELSDILGVKVDLMTEPSLKNKKLKEYVYQDIQMILNEGR